MRRFALFLTLSCLAVGSWVFGETQPAEPLDASRTLEIERSKLGWVGVNLRGGLVGYEGTDGATPLPTATTTASGRVIDARGEPLEGVVVLGGDAFAVFSDALTGRDGTYTDADGRFQLAVDEDASVVAVHLQHGMSRVVAAQQGEDVELTIEPFAWVEGFVREHASPSEARVIVQSPDRTFSFVAETDASGHYTIGPLPPGRYRIEAYDQSSSGLATVSTVPRPSASTMSTPSSAAYPRARTPPVPARISERRACT